MKLVLVIAAAITCLMAVPSAAAQVDMPSGEEQGETLDGENDEGESTVGLPGSTSSREQGGTARLERTAGRNVVTEPPANPVVAATVIDAGPPEASAEVPEPTAPLDDGCLERAPSEYNAAEDIYYSGRCVKRLVCGAERVDDVVSGDIAGEDALGRYGSFLSEMIGYFGADSPPAGAGLGDAASVNDFLLAGGLGDSAADDAIPVFYWCAPQHESGVFDPIEIATASFGWDLTYDEVYDIPGVRASLYLELTAALDLYDPQVGLVPPASGGYTFVQWPTWMFLENPLEREHVFTHNDTNTFRIDLRATLERVDWHFGEELVAQCSVAEMLKYDPEVHHPIEDLPACNHRFTQLASQDLTTTIFYKIEEQIRDRIADPLSDYADEPWVDYLGTPTLFELSSTLDDYEVHELVSVNVSQTALANGITSD